MFNSCIGVKISQFTYLCTMQNRRLGIYGLVLVLLAVVIGGILAAQKGFFRQESGNTDTLPAIRTITPEIEQYSLALQQDSMNAGIYFNRANAYFDYGNLKYALEDFSMAYAIDSSQAAYALGYSDCLFEMSQAQQAIEILLSYERRYPGNPDILMNLAIDYFLLPEPKYQLAINQLNELLRLDIQNAPAYFYKGLIYKESGDTAKAISNFQACTEVDPDYYDAWMQLGLIYADRGDPLAIQYYDNAMATGDTSREAAYAKAKFFQDKGDVDNAINYYRQIIIRNPQDADALYNLATIYFGIDSVEKAFRYFDLSVKQSPAKAYAHYGMGLCAEKLERKQEALAYFQQALNLDPELTFIQEKIDELKAQ